MCQKIKNQILFIKQIHIIRILLLYTRINATYFFNLIHFLERISLLGLLRFRLHIIFENKIYVISLFFTNKFINKYIMKPEKESGPRHRFLKSPEQKAQISSKDSFSTIPEFPSQFLAAGTTRDRRLKIDLIISEYSRIT